MTRFRHDKGRVVRADSDRAIPGGKKGPRNRGSSKSGPVTSNKPAARRPMCCNMELPANGKCPNCSD